MLNLQTALIELEFEFGRANDRFINIVISDAKSKFNVFPYEDNGWFGHVALPVQLPTKIFIECSGKTDQDVIVDKNNNIIQDTYVKIKNIKIDGFFLSKNYIDQKIIQHTSTGEEIISSYIGHNCSIVLDFSKNNAIYQVLYANQ